MMTIPDEHDLVIQAMIDQGMSDGEIAEQYRAKRSEVWYFRRRHGIASLYGKPKPKLSLIEPPPPPATPKPTPRPRQIGERFDEAYRHVVRVFEPWDAMGDLQQEVDDDRREQEI